MITKARARKCTTHHYACDCREHRFRELVEVTGELVDALRDIELYVPETVPVHQVDRAKIAANRFIKIQHGLLEE